MLNRVLAGVYVHFGMQIHAVGHMALALGLLKMSVLHPARQGNFGNLSKIRKRMTPEYDIRVYLALGTTGGERNNSDLLLLRSGL